MQIEELYSKVFRICVQFAVYHKKILLEDLNGVLTLLDTFTNDFFNENRFEIEEEDYQLLKQLLLNILNDIVEGMKFQDELLLEDTLEYGLKELLELIISDEEKLQQLREGCIDECGNI